MTRASISTPILSIVDQCPRIVRPWLAVLLAVAAALPVARAQTVLPGTKPLTFEGDPALGMVDAIRTFLDRETTASEAGRTALPASDPAARRERFRRLIGAV